MQSHFQPNPSGRGGGTRSSMAGAMPYMSESQTKAYLMARDTIRRIQRTASMFDSKADAPARPPRTAQGRPAAD